MRRKPLFPPPEETVIDPLTKRLVTKRLANKGRQSTHVLTVNGRIVLNRRWWHSASEGSAAPADTFIARQSQTVTDGVIERNALIRVTRGDIVVEKDRKLDQLKRFKDDAKEVRTGQECGMKIEAYDYIKVGDVLECYKKLEVRRTL